MALSTLVKISGVNNLSEARYCAGMGAGILGFCPEPGHPDFVDIKKFREISGWVQGVKFAGEFYSSQIESVIEADREYHFDYLQVIRPDFVGVLKKSGKPVIFTIDLSVYENWEGAKSEMRQLSSGVDFFLIQGGILSENWLKEICESSGDFRIIMGTGITKESLNKMNTQCRFSGFAFKGSGEIKPGYLEPGELGELMEMLETDI